MIRWIIFDLDGTVYHGNKVVDGAAEFIRDLPELSIGYSFLTNRSNRTPESVLQQIHGYGIPCTQENVLTSALAAAAYINSASVYVIGEEGLKVALRNGGATFDDTSPQFVAVGYDASFDMNKLEIATRLIRNGARLIATNMDMVINSDCGMIPENGPIVRAIEAATGTDATVVGKPDRFVMKFVLNHIGKSNDEVLMVGDNPETDIRAGINGDILTALILTGVTKTHADAKASAYQAKWVVENYANLRLVVEEHNESCRE